jgi:P-type Mg2+ transporter
MSDLPTSVLPRRIPRGPQGGAAIRVAPLVLEAAGNGPEHIFQKLQTAKEGLSTEEAERRLREYGPNVVAREERHPHLQLLGKALINPLVILLLVLATISASSVAYSPDAKRLDAYSSAIIMLLMVVLGVVLRFVQESRADSAAAKLRAMISVKATVLRDGRPQEVPIGSLVPGDVVELAAGDMIPADIRLVSCKDLFLIQGSLTGESFPVEKFAVREVKEDRPPLELPNICYLGTSVESGAATAVVVATGLTTYLGGMARAIVDQNTQTSFDRGVSQFTWLMIRFIFVMVPLVFLINGVFKGDWPGAFMFSLAIAVGLTPEMLPMIVAVCLSKGAMGMSRKRVIVKRLNSIQNLGAMDVLCTDKTGTLTMDHIILEKYCDVVLAKDKDVLVLAYLNSHFQTGLKNLIDRAILQHSEVQEGLALPEFSKVDEIPFDFSRKVMSVVVQTPEKVHRLICKGAPEEVYKRCSGFSLDGQLYPMEHLIMVDLKEEFDQLSADGFRVLALAYKDLNPKPAYSKDDEKDLILRGYVAFLDPPKDSARLALAALQEHGIAVKVLTGDNELVSKKICKEVGISTEHVLLGGQVEKMTDAQLTEAANRTTLFARLSPAHKQRIIKTLQAAGHVVGFLGDGINDAPALRAADVGISVDTAVDIAKESADAILLEKDLMVLEEGVLEGRKVFANILKYIRMGASSNFGNMFSVLGASIWLPYLPMVAIQLLTLNLLYDFSQVPIPTDEVDPEQIKKPRPWSMSAIARFILFIGPCSSIFDYTTFFIMVYVFGCWSKESWSLFQTGWFVESLLTQTLIIHIIRTNRIPFIQSWASWPLIVTTITIMMIGAWLPFSPLAFYFGFVPLPRLYWPLIFLTLFGYVVVTQTVKTWLLRKGWVSQ